MNAFRPHFLVIAVFAGIVASGGGVQLGIELLQGQKPQPLDLFARLPTPTHLRAYEASLEEQSWVSRRLRPWVLYGQFVVFRNPGSRVLLGHDGWWFYRPSVEYAIRRNLVRSATQDPVAAICDFRDQLAARQIELLVLPAPNKESVYPEKLARRAAGVGSMICPPTESVLRRLRAAGVEVVNLFELYAKKKQMPAAGEAGSLYLAQDTHWSPLGLQLAAQAVAERLIERRWIQPGATAYQTRSAPQQRWGDLVRMLQLPQVQAGLAPEQMECTQVLDSATGAPCQNSADAGILVLGDSYLRIFQEDEPGSAGFAAHLARQLRQPVASIVNEGGASTLVRQELHRRPALLAGKRVVIWEFAERDIALGTEGWQRVPLPQVHSAP